MTLKPLKEASTHPKRQEGTLNSQVRARMLKIIDHPSPNFNERPNGILPNLLIFHYTGMKSGIDALHRMCDEHAKVSAHFMIEEDGTVYRLVPEHMQAWHAGISCWRGRAALNETSIGIEMVNPGHEHGYRPFPQVQMESAVDLAKNIVDRYHIEPQNILGHSDIAPNRKDDPGELFNWEYLASHHIGLWPSVKLPRKHDKILAHPGDESTDVASIQKCLSDYGYHIRVDGKYHQKTEEVIRAFRRHFIQNDLSAYWDVRCQATIDALLAY